MDTFSEELTVISVVSKPTEDTSKVTGKSSTLKEKFPLKSVVDPADVPFTITLAPGNGLLLLV